LEIDGEGNLKDGAPAAAAPAPAAAGPCCGAGSDEQAAKVTTISKSRTSPSSRQNFIGNLLIRNPQPGFARPSG